MARKGGRTVIATFGHAAVGWMVATALVLSVALMVWGWRRPGALLGAALLALFFCVAESPSIGLLLLPLPWVQFGRGLWLRLRAPTALRLPVAAAGGAACVLAGARLIARLLL